MDRSSSPMSASPSIQEASPPSSPIAESDLIPISQELEARKKKTRKKRKSGDGGDDNMLGSDRKIKKGKKRKEGKGDRKHNQQQHQQHQQHQQQHNQQQHQQHQQQSHQEAPMDEGRKKARKHPRRGNPGGMGMSSASAENNNSGSGGNSNNSKEPVSAAQVAVNEQMRRALEEDQYSAVGSVVDTDSEEEENHYRTRSGMVRLDRAMILQSMRKRLWMERMNGSSGSALVASPLDDLAEEQATNRNRKKKRKKGRRHKEEDNTGGPVEDHDNERAEDAQGDTVTAAEDATEEVDRDEGSIFGQTTGSSNATWVECDKCKKWRRLRGVVDEKKLPSKWYCSMNKNDPDRARCSAPEEEYETPNTPESAADARIRKHLRVWVRRLESNENYEARQPTMTRGKKRTVATAKEPYEWVRCCNPSCGKWRAILRFMDAKQHVISRTTNGEWYCVMNTWDEKTASCAAPQENLPAIGCPPWVMQDE